LDVAGLPIAAYQPLLIFGIPLVYLLVKGMRRGLTGLGENRPARISPGSDVREGRFLYDGRSEAEKN
jgi:hypothetical protein